MTFLFYDLYSSYEANIKKHPQEYMNEHFKVIHAVPQSIADGWWFCVEDFDFELPSFLSKMHPYNLNYWKDGCYKTCEYFKKSFDCATQRRDDRYSCHGGYDCLKEKYDSIEEFEKNLESN